MNSLPNGLIVICKRDCPTCEMVEPVLQQLEKRNAPLTVYTQDDPSFPSGVSQVIDDTELEWSYRLNIEIVPTLIRVEEGQEVERTVGWKKTTWRTITGIPDLGVELPELRPGCGSRSLEPGVVEKLDARFGQSKLKARRVELATLEDEIEACFERGWSDGLPLVPPTEARVLRMLEGTSRTPDDIIGIIPPNNNECTVEKAAINAVLAGCKPEYLPVVLAAIEAACDDTFCMHGVLATTYFSSPIVIVNGPVTKAIGMNSGVNALGQGNRANATIGRALQLVIRNVGGGVPGGVDRATLGNPGKYTFCFAENEEDTPWEPLSVERGFSPGSSAVTLFAGNGVQDVYDQQSRQPESLAASFAACLRTITHPKVVLGADALLVVSPEHLRVFQKAGWSKRRLKEEIHKLLQLPVETLARGAGGIAEGMPAQLLEGKKTMSKFRPDGLMVVQAGGNAGLFSAIISGWANSGPRGSRPVTREIIL